MVAIDDDPVTAADKYQWESFVLTPRFPTTPLHEEDPEHDRQD